MQIDQPDVAAVLCAGAEGGEGDEVLPGAPGRVGTSEKGELAGLAGVVVVKPDLVPAGGIGDPGDFLAVRRDRRIAVIALPTADLLRLAPGDEMALHLAEADAPDVTAGIFLLRDENQGSAVRIPDRIEIVGLVEGDLPAAGTGGAAHPDIEIVGLPGDVGEVFAVGREAWREIDVGMGGHLPEIEGLGCSRSCGRGGRLHRRAHRGGRTGARGCDQARTEQGPEEGRPCGGAAPWIGRRAAFHHVTFPGLRAFPPRCHPDSESWCRGPNYRN
ncbi:MAG: hypothetical protein BWY77_00655 [bacterium ADurb.Bin431]|nr:MAG: hypothetical protein BWY77_00655 [bacterium ADurb.Bin431]